jgi:DNA repair exonuclease SbcCD ATPase subunit
MKIQKVEWKNFASYGNKLHSIEFESDTGNFYLVTGANGSGKSTVSDVIKFAIYGKLDNKKLKDIPNRFNKSAWCKITLQKDSFTTVEIERGVSPGILRCFVNGQEFDQAGKRNVQEYIESEIIGLPFYVFTNIISLSINDFKSFLTMRAHDKRSIIDKIFSLDIVNRIKRNVKEEVKSSQTNVSLLQNESDVLSRSITTSESELTNLKKKLEKLHTSKVSDITDKLSGAIKIINTVATQINAIDKDLKKVSNLKKSLSSLLVNALANKNTIQRKQEMYDNDSCPVCGGDLSSEFHIEKSAKNDKEIEKYTKELNNLNNKKTKLLNKEKELKAKRTILIEKKHSTNTNIQHYKRELEDIENSKKTEQTKSLVKLVKDAKRNLKKVSKTKIQQERKTNFYKILEEIFGDKGVKLLAIKRILPTINKEINRVIRSLNMEYRVIFDEEFESTVTHLGHAVSAQMLSTGERKKLDFAVLIALIKMLKIKFHGLNLIFLDEIFSSVDSDGIFHILSILSKLCKELQLNIFVINHSPLPTEIFDYKIEVSKTNGFSQMDSQKID